MTPTQRAAALRLAAKLDEVDVDPHSMFAVENAAALLRELAAEPAQEPVALMWQHEETGRVTFTTVADPYVGKRWHRIPLYAAPQQRQPLDAAAVQELKLRVVGKPYLTVEQLVRQVERLHGITGEPT